MPDSSFAIRINDRGEPVVVPEPVIETQEERHERIRAAVATVRGTGKFGMATNDHMALIRGPYEDERGTLNAGREIDQRAHFIKRPEAW